MQKGRCFILHQKFSIFVQRLFYCLISSGFWGYFFFEELLPNKKSKKVIVLSPKKHQENDHFEAFQENVNSNGYIKRAFKFVKWDRSYSLALICLKMKPKSPHNLRNRTACIRSRNSVTVFLFSYNHAACLHTTCLENA